MNSIIKTMGCIFVYMLFLSAAVQVQAGVTSIYPFPTSMAAGLKFQVWADDQPVSVWRADANADIANFAYSGSVTIRVRLKDNANFTTATLTPGIFGIRVKKTANEVTFVLSNPQKSRVVLRIDNDPQKDLFIWGDPPVEGAPAGAVVYKAGSHNFEDGLLTLRSNTTYYLAPGSVLHAQVIIPANAANVKVLGRGIIVAEYRGRYEHCFIIQDFCSSIEINGVTLTNNNFPDFTEQDEYLDLHQLVIRGYGTHDIKVTNFKIIGEYYTSDGIALSGCYNVVVQDCFVVAADNAFSIGWEGTTDNCRLLRTVLHQTRGIYTSAMFPQGYYETGTPSELKNITIKDLWISQTMGTILGCNFGNSFEKVSDFLIENVYVDRIYLYDDIDGDGERDYQWAVDDGANKFISMELTPTLGGEITLRNVHWVEDKDYEGELTAGWKITYDNVYYNNRLVTAVENSHVNLNGGELIIRNTTPPSVSTTTPSSITRTTAGSGGNVTAGGGASVTARGVCWSTSANPTTANSKTTNGTGTGTFTSSITGLTAGTTYHVRAYATNSAGTSYGRDRQFTTTSAGIGTWNKIKNAATGWISSGGSITGSVAINTTAVNLSTAGTCDWKHFRSNDHKAGGSMINSISDYTVIGGAASYYANDLRSMSWTGGTPAASATNNKNGSYIGGVNKGFSFTAPAGNGSKILKVYVGGYNSRGRLTAHLSNSATINYVNSTPTGTGQYNAVYTIAYNAARAGQTIIITWVQLAGAGNVTIQGAALAGTARKPANSSAQPEIGASLSSIRVYPNPATDFVTIDFKKNLNNEKAEVELMDLLGRKVYGSGIVSRVSSLQININGYPKGNYIIRIRKGRDRVNKKLIIE